MEQTLVLKAIADESRMKILKLLLQHNYCVRAVARKLDISEAAVSQHLKVMREAGLLVGEKKGYFMHYDVNRDVLHNLAKEIETLALIEQEACTPEQGRCKPSESDNCHFGEKDKGSDEVKKLCHGHENGHTCNCKYHRKSEEQY